MKTYRSLAIVFGFGVGFGAATARSAAPFEPVRRDATIEFQRVDLDLGVQSVTGTLTIPKATTRELAEYGNTAGGAAAAKWFCSAYVGLPDDAPEAGTLRTLIQRAAADGEAGRVAANSLVCPRVRRNAYERIPILNCIFDVFDECKPRWRTVVSGTLAFGTCEATDAQRDAFDAATCETILRGHSGRAKALRAFSRRAARRNGCLQINIRNDQTPKRSGAVRVDFVSDCE
jgi:hypothetical protein